MEPRTGRCPGVAAAVAGIPTLTGSAQAGDRGPGDLQGDNGQTNQPWTLG